MLKANLRLTDFKLSVCKLADENLPLWACSSRFLSYTKTPSEYSLVCDSACVPDNIMSESGWDCFMVDGILDFSLVGVIADITRALAQKQISVFVISTHDTDYVLVKENNTEDAKKALTSQGYKFTE